MSQENQHRVYRDCIVHALLQSKTPVITAIRSFDSGFKANDPQFTHFCHWNSHNSNEVLLNWRSAPLLIFDGYPIASRHTKFIHWPSAVNDIFAPEVTTNHSLWYALSIDLPLLSLCTVKVFTWNSQWSSVYFYVNLRTSYVLFRLLIS